MTEVKVEMDKPEVDISELPAAESPDRQEIEVGATAGEVEEAPGSRTPSRRNSRHTSRATSRRSVRTRSAKRPLSAPFAAELAYNLYSFTSKIEDSAAIESEFMNVSEEPLLDDDATNGTEAYLRACAHLDIQPRGKIITQMRDSVTEFDFGNCQLGHKGVCAMESFLLQKGEEITALSFGNSQMRTDGLINLVRIISKIKSPGLRIIDLSDNGIVPQSAIVLEPGCIIPGLPAETLDFAKEYRKNILLNRQKAAEDAKKTPEQLEKEKKNQKETENIFKDRPTVLLGMGKNLTRPYPPPEKTEKNTNKAPVVPELRALDAQEALSTKINSLGLDAVNVAGQCLKQLLEYCVSLEIVNLANNELGDETISAMCSGLSGTKLQVLNLKNCGLSTNSMLPLIKLMEMSPELKSMDLSHNKITHCGAALLGCAIANGRCSLSELDLSSNPLGDVGASIILASMDGQLQLGKKARKTPDDKTKGQKDAKEVKQSKATLQIVSDERNEKFESEKDGIKCFADVIARQWDKALETCYIEDTKKYNYLTTVPQRGAELINARLQSCQMNTYSSLVLCDILHNANEIGTLDVSGNTFGQVEYYRVLKEIAGRGTKKQENIVLSFEELLPELLESELPTGSAEELDDLYVRVQAADGVCLVE